MKNAPLPSPFRFVFLSLALGFAALAPGDSLDDGFAHPPDSAKPRTWWHWVSGNVHELPLKARVHAATVIDRRDNCFPIPTGIVCFIRFDPADDPYS